MGKVPTSIKKKIKVKVKQPVKVKMPKGPGKKTKKRRANVAKGLSGYKAQKKLLAATEKEFTQLKTKVVKLSKEYTVEAKKAAKASAALKKKGAKEKIIKKNMKTEKGAKTKAKKAKLAAKAANKKKLAAKAKIAQIKKKMSGFADKAQK